MSTEKNTIEDMIAYYKINPSKFIDDYCDDLYPHQKLILKIMLSCEKVISMKPLKYNNQKSVYEQIRELENILCQKDNE